MNVTQVKTETHVFDPQTGLDKDGYNRRGYKTTGDFLIEFRDGGAGFVWLGYVFRLRESKQQPEDKKGMVECYHCGTKIYPLNAIRHDSPGWRKFMCCSRECAYVSQEQHMRDEYPPALHPDLYNEDGSIK